MPKNHVKAQELLKQNLSAQKGHNAEPIFNADVDAVVKCVAGAGGNEQQSLRADELDDYIPSDDELVSIDGTFEGSSTVETTQPSSVQLCKALLPSAAQQHPRIQFCKEHLHSP